MFNWLKTHKKWLVPTSIATIIISLLFSITLHLQHRKQEERVNSAAGKNDSAAGTDNQSTLQDAPGQIPDLPAKMIPDDKVSGFSQTPSPAELTHKLEVMDAHERRTEEGRIADLRIIWPLYFFSITKRGQDTATMMLDASEDGFGVIIVTEISLLRYPGVAAALPGDKIWVAGKITEVDTHGTGQIILNAEYVGIADRKQEL
jgi:hypothetical protein